MISLAAMPAALLMLLAGLYFGLAAAAGLTALDAGELGAAAHELGIAHPPGMPVFLLLHKALMLVLPLGDAAFRGSLASALIGAAALAAGLEAARALGVRSGPALGGLALAGAAPIFALHATTIEVYSGTALLTALLVLSAARLARDTDARWAAALGLLLGLAGGHYAELRLFGLILAPAAAWRLRRSPRAFVPIVAFGLLGALVLLYLPLRSATEPWRDWGAPRTLEALWAHWSGARIRTAFSHDFAHLDVRSARIWAAQAGDAWPVLLLGLPGFLALARRPAGAVVGLLWLADTLYALLLNPMGLADRQNGVPGLLLLGLGAGAAIDGLGRRVASPLLGAAAIALAALLIVLSPPADPSARGLSALLDAAADSSPPQAVVAVASDTAAAGWAFAQVVEGARPDLAILVRQHLWDVSSTGPVTRRLPWALAAFTDGNHPRRWEWARGQDADASPPGAGPDFPYFSAGGRDDGAFEAALDALTTRHPDAGPLVADLLQDLGIWRLPTSPARAVVALGQAAQRAPQSRSAWNNLAAARAAAGDPRGAAEATRRALALEPEDGRTHAQLVRYLLNGDDDPTAAFEVGQLLEADPENAEALALDGLLAARRGDLAKAAERFRQALERDATQPEARAGEAQLRRMSRPR